MILAYLIYTHYIGMCTSRQSFCLDNEPASHLRDHVKQELDGDSSVEQRILCKEYSTHSSFTDLANDLEVRNLFSY